MIKVIDQLDRAKLDDYLKNNIEVKLKEEIDTAWSKLTKQDLKPFKFWYSFLFWIMIFILVLATGGLILAMWSKLPIIKKREETRRKFIGYFGEDILYHKASKGIDNFEIVSYEKHSSTKDLWAFRRNGIPGDAKVIEATDVARIKFRDKYEGILRMGRMMWTRSNGKSTQTYFANTAYMQINVDNFKKTNLELNYRNKLLKGTLLENNEFNKSFQLEAESKQDANLIFTPLVQEEFVKASELGSSFKWKIEYKNGNILVKWKPKWWQDSIVSAYKVKFKSKESALKNIYQEIKSNMEDLHTISYISLLPLIGK